MTGIPTGVSRARAARVMLGFAWHADRRRCVAVLGLQTLLALAGSLFAWWLKVFVDAAEQRRMVELVWVCAAIAASVTALAALDYAVSRVTMTLNDHVHHLVELRLLELVGRTPTLEIHETPAHLAQLELLESESWQFGDVIPTGVRALETGVRVVISVALLASVNPLLLALPLFGLPAIAAGPKASGLWYRGRLLAADPLRRMATLFELSTASGPAKEIRLLRLHDELLRRFAAAQHEQCEIQLRLQVRGEALRFVTRFVFITGYVGAIVLVVRNAVRGHASLGDVLLTAVLAGQVLTLIAGSAELTQWVSQTLTAAGRFVYLDDIATLLSRPTGDPVAAPARLTDGIRLQDVSFRYPGRKTDTLHGLDLTLASGATVAIVGDNGAGKSTVVKLLAGLYRPTSGSITVDGIELAGIDPARWRQRVSAGFADHARFEFTVRETVGMGDLSRLGDADHVAGAIERAASSDVFASLPHGLDTQLGPSWPGGVDLSGGQWQKLAIARAMMRDRPLLLLLDEPTAALDAESEHRLFERWTQAARDVRAATGAITVLVSHRFSTVRMADLIVVLDQGRVAETGTHEELASAGGLYAELFDIQARAYRT